MIESWADYLLYLEADRLALRVSRRWPRPMMDFVWRYQRLLRTVEYLRNNRNPLTILAYPLAHVAWRRLGLRLGMEIPPNTFGPGLSIAHGGPIVVHPNARIGSNCRIHNSVTIGATSGSNVAPRIGDNVFIGPCTTIVGDITIADEVAVGANSFVNRSFTRSNVSLGGVPARQISEGGSRKNVIRAHKAKGEH